MTINEKYKALQKGAREYVAKVRDRKRVNSGHYTKDVTSINATELRRDIQSAAQLGYETHLTVTDGKITIWFVANMPTCPYVVYYG